MNNADSAYQHNNQMVREELNDIIKWCVITLNVIQDQMVGDGTTTTIHNSRFNLLHMDMFAYVHITKHTIAFNKMSHQNSSFNDKYC
ncbi:hypothetical protein BLOT_010371 [Blomia tropicalis]|nr:hypothetical protein BLOT_010371 [Blomia tropicalis]